MTKIMNLGLSCQLFYQINDDPLGNSKKHTCAAR